MTNIIDSIIDYTLRSNSITLNKIGNTLYVNRQMATNRENFVTESITSDSAMKNILMEMKLLLNGRYAGNKDYLFERMDYLINSAIENQSKNQKTVKPKPTFAVNKKKVADLCKSKMQKRCKKSGRFIAAKKRK